MIQLWLVVLFAVFLAAGCQKKDETKKETESAIKEETGIKNDQNRIYYEIFVRSFADSNGDGIGDINGITSKLDYLEDLGIEGIWLTPIMPSPSYHGYDVTDYRGINPAYGTLEDFKKLVKEAHSRNIKVLMDLVINHTSIDHPWFQKALKGDPAFKDYYVWAGKDSNKNQVGDWGQKVWHEKNQQLYEGSFSDSMPDLNYDSKSVRSEMENIGEFWLENTGIDGFRLDAAKYLYSFYQSPKNNEKTIDFWKEFNEKMQKIKPNVFLVGEVWDTPGVVGPYLKGLNSAFNFDLSEVMINTAKLGDDRGIVSRVSNVRDFYQKNNPNFMDSIFLTNHDTNRLMSRVNNDVNKAKMAAALLLTLPGNPFIYYGEEIGLEGNKPDEYLREPFIWNQTNDPAQTDWMEEKYNNNKPEIALSEQMKDNDSLFNHYKNLIHARKNSLPLKSGEIAEAPYKEAGLVAFKRVADKEEVTVLHNVSSKEIAIKNVEKKNNIYFATFNISNVKNTITLPSYSTLILK
ncbi:alpha-amylase family glycosyl hydrolase [Niallia sp. 03133]|uniref:alpha-amylase family glycosyl hydrolase n=1 Tax=Niallia sp. 03133 TaxID=3458060 RepID=UPI0040441233